MILEKKNVTVKDKQAERNDNVSKWKKIRNWQFCEHGEGCVCNNWEEHEANEDI